MARPYFFIYLSIESILFPWSTTLSFGQVFLTQSQVVEVTYFYWIYTSTPSISFSKTTFYIFKGKIFFWIHCKNEHLFTYTTSFVSWMVFVVNVWAHYRSSHQILWVVCPFSLDDLFLHWIKFDIFDVVLHKYLLFDSCTTKRSGGIMVWSFFEQFLGYLVPHWISRWPFCYLYRLVAP